MSERQIAALAAVPRDSTLLFRVRHAESGAVHEAILVRTNGDVTGWRNQCQHFRHIPLDNGDGAPMRDREIVCQNHGAMFRADSGRCTFGPCEGAYLETVQVAVDDGAVVLTDDRYAFVGRGPIERDETDLTSRSNVEF